MNERKNSREQFEVIGEFVSKVNFMEFTINILLEKIIMQYSEISDIKDIAEYTIDHIEEQSVKNRINFIILFLVITNGDSEVVKRAIIELKDFAKYYNKYIRNIRDFIAHNPHIAGGGDSLIISSRRYKGKLNSLKIEDLKTHVNSLIPKVIELFRLTEELSILYPKEIVRELS